jgi:sugar lactone lactonase YvrE
MLGMRVGVSALACVLLTLLVPLPAASQAAITALVQFEPPILPEGLTVDNGGTIYVGIATKGEIRRISPDGQQSTLTTLRPGLGSLLGLAIDPQGNVVAALASTNTPGSDQHGIWRVKPDGAKELVAAMPPQTMPNGLAFGTDGTLFVSDSNRGTIWRIGQDGSAAPWLKDELLDADLQACPPRQLLNAVGPNGIVVEPNGSLLVANTTRAQIVRIPMSVNGSAGTPTVAHGPDCAMLAGADGMALDQGGALYVTLNWQNRLVRIDTNGAMEVVATQADGLDFPASVAVSGDGLLVTNYAQLSYLKQESPQPGLLRLARR